MMYVWQLPLFFVVDVFLKYYPRSLNAIFIPGVSDVGIVIRLVMNPFGPDQMFVCSKYILV